MPAFNTIDEILEDLRLGKMAVIMDDEDRENEGDLIMAADCARPQDVNFHGALRPRTHLFDAHARALPSIAPAAHGERYRLHASHQLHSVDRGRRGGDHREYPRTIARTRSRPRWRPTRGRRTCVNRVIFFR